MNKAFIYTMKSYIKAVNTESEMHLEQDTIPQKADHQSNVFMVQSEFH